MYPAAVVFELPEALILLSMFATIMVDIMSTRSPRRCLTAILTAGPA